MKPTINFRFYVVILALILSVLACSVGQPKATPTPTKVPTKVPTKTAMPTNTPEPTMTSENLGALTRQWASSGEATSSFGSDSWSAQQAAGAPDTLTCGDHVSAWASESSRGVDSLTLYYFDQPVIPTEINIVQSYNPSQVVKVELLDAYGQYSDATIYESEPIAISECPYTLSIPVTGIDYLVMGIRISVDQSVLGLGWNEIDAVELVGYPEAGYVPPAGQESIPGLAGTWQDPESYDTFVIAWQDGQYVVTSVTWEGSSYAITYQYWDGSYLTWSYYDPDLGVTVTYSTIYLSGDSLDVDWWYDNGTSYTETLGRIP